MTNLQQCYLPVAFLNFKAGIWNVSKIFTLGGFYDYIDKVCLLSVHYLSGFQNEFFYKRSRLLSIIF